MINVGHDTRSFTESLWIKGPKVLCKFWLVAVELGSRLLWSLCCRLLVTKTNLAIPARDIANAKR